MGMQVGGNKKGTLAEMNVVPLIDILLVLLIIFMVITPTIPAGLRAEIPQPATDTVGPAPAPVVVQVSANGELKINNEVTSWEGLGPRLQEIFRYRATKVAFIKGESTAPFSVVARAMDVMHSAGVDQVGLMTERM